MARDLAEDIVVEWEGVAQLVEEGKLIDQAVLVDELLDNARIERAPSLVCSRCGLVCGAGWGGHLGSRLGRGAAVHAGAGWQGRVQHARTTHCSKPHIIMIT